MEDIIIKRLDLYFYQLQSMVSNWGVASYSELPESAKKRWDELTFTVNELTDILFEAGVDTPFLEKVNDFMVSDWVDFCCWTEE